MLKKVKHENISRYLSCFKAYHHSIPAIYSFFEHQYDGDLFVNNLEKPSFGILFSFSDYHYVFGEIDYDEAIKDLERCIYTYIKENAKEEMILLYSASKIQPFMEHLIHAFHGVIDERYAFEFDEASYHQVICDTSCVALEKEQGYTSKIPYLTAVIKKEAETISYCKAFMIGNRQVELAVWTKEAYRNMGYAKACTMRLIEECLAHGLTLNWTAWKAKIKSHELAKSVGFKLKQIIPAYVWVSSFKEIK